MSVEPSHRSERRAHPSGFSRVRMILAREPGYPEGSEDIGYFLIVPLDSEGRIEASKWAEHREHFRVVHFRPGQEDSIGHLVRGPGGNWHFRYDLRTHEDDASGYHFADEHFAVGEYVSVREETGLHTYRVISVQPL